MPAATAPVRNCINCGLRLVQPAVGRKRVYCSTLCRVGRWYQAHRQPAHLHHDWVEDGDDVICLTCGKTWQPAHLHHDWVEDGNDVICLTCGKTWQLVNGAGGYGEADHRG